MGIPPSQFMGRPTVTTTVIVDGVTRTTTASPWTSEDQALMLAWTEYQASLCQGCGQPRSTSRHPYMEGWYETEHETCWACTAMKEPGEDGTRSETTYPLVIDTRDHDANPLPVIPQT